MCESGGVEFEGTVWSEVPWRMGHIRGFGAIIDTADTCVLRPAHMQFQSLVATAIAVPVLRACSRRWGAREDRSRLRGKAP